MKHEMIGDIPASELELILGFKPGREQILDILNRARESGQCIGQVARAGSIPPMYYDFDHTGYIDTKDAGRIKVEDYQKLHPWLRLIVITGRETEQ